MKIWTILLCCVALLVPSAAHAQGFDWNKPAEQEQAQPEAQQQQKNWEKKGVPGSPEYIRAIADAARKLLPTAKYGDGKVVGPETAEEKKRSTFIPQAGLDRAVKEGALVGYAMHCGLDWQKRAYLPLLQQEVSSGLWDKKQIRYIQIVIDLTRESYAKNLPGSCSAEMKEFISSKMVK